MGRQTGNDGIGHVLRKVKSCGPAGPSFASGWVPSIGKLRKSASSHNDDSQRERHAEDVWDVSETDGRLTPDLLPKALPEECPPASPREPCDSLRDSRKKRGKCPRRAGPAGQDRPPPGGRDGSPDPQIIGAQTRGQLHQMLESISEAPDWRHSREDEEVDPQVEAALDRHALRNLRSPRPGRGAVEIGGLEEESLVCVQKIKLELRPAPHAWGSQFFGGVPSFGENASKDEDAWASDDCSESTSSFEALQTMVVYEDEPQNTYWEVFSELGCEVPDFSGLDEMAEGLEGIEDSMEAQSVADMVETDSVGDVLSKHCAEKAACVAAGKAVGEAGAIDEEFSFPETAARGYVGERGKPEYDGLWSTGNFSDLCGGVQEYEAATGHHETNYSTSDDELVFDAVYEDDLFDGETYGCGKDRSPIYNDGAIYSLDKGGEVSYVQEGEDDGCKYGMKGNVELNGLADQADLSNDMYEEKDFDTEDELQGSYSPGELNMLDEEGAEEFNRTLGGVPSQQDGRGIKCNYYGTTRVDTDGGAAARLGSFEVGPLQMYTDEHVAGCDENSGVEGARDRARESFDTAEGDAFDTALDFHDTRAVPFVSADLGNSQNENNCPMWVYDTAHTLGYETYSIQSNSLWDTSYSAYGSLNPSYHDRVSQSFSVGENRSVLDTPMSSMNKSSKTVRSKAGYPSTEARNMFDSCCGSIEVPAEASKPESISSPRCFEPGGLLGGILRKLTGKRHRKPSAADVPVPTPSRSTWMQDSLSRKQSSRYTKRQASMLKVVEERLQSRNADPKNGEYDPSQMSFNDSAVDLVAYEADKRTFASREHTTRVSTNKRDVHPNGDGRFFASAGRKGGHRRSLGSSRCEGNRYGRAAHGRGAAPIHA